MVKFVITLNTIHFRGNLIFISNAAYIRWTTYERMHFKTYKSIIKAFWLSAFLWSEENALVCCFAYEHMLWCVENHAFYVKVCFHRLKYAFSTKS